MEIKFKEVNDKYVSFKDFRDEDICDIKDKLVVDSLKIKPYLTLSELKSIVDSALEESDMVIRQMTIVSMVVDYCTNLDIVDKNNQISCEEVYDLCVKYNIMECRYLINNYEDIDELIDKSESTYKIAEILVGQIKESLKNFDMNKIQQEIFQLQDTLVKSKDKE